MKIANVSEEQECGFFETYGSLLGMSKNLGDFISEYREEHNKNLLQKWNVMSQPLPRSYEHGFYDALIIWRNTDIFRSALIKKLIQSFQVPQHSICAICQSPASNYFDSNQHIAVDARILLLKNIIFNRTVAKTPKHNKKSARSFDLVAKQKRSIVGIQNLPDLKIDTRKRLEREFDECSQRFRNGGKLFPEEKQDQNQIARGWFVSPECWIKRPHSTPRDIVLFGNYILSNGDGIWAKQYPKQAFEFTPIFGLFFKPCKIGAIKKTIFVTVEDQYCNVLCSLCGDTFQVLPLPQAQEHEIFEKSHVDDQFYLVHAQRQPCTNEIYHRSCLEQIQRDVSPKKLKIS